MTSVVVGGACILGAAIWSQLSPTKALDVMTNFSVDATVRARVPGGRWQECTARPVIGDFECGKLGRVHGGLSSVINDLPFSWAYSTPSVLITPDAPSEYEISLDRNLEGTYLGGAWGRGVSASLSGQGVGEVNLGTTATTVGPIQPPARRLRLVITSPLGERGGVSVVRADALDVDRNSDVPIAPESAPPL